MDEQQLEVYQSLVIFALIDERLYGNWIAMDKNGEFYSYTKKPSIVVEKYTCRWFSETEMLGFECKLSDKFNNLVIKNYRELCGVLPWEDSLVKIN